MRKINSRGKSGQMVGKEIDQQGSWEKENQQRSDGDKQQACHRQSEGAAEA